MCIRDRYVDDNVLAGPDKQETKVQVDRILSKLSGRIIEPDVRRDGMMWDCLGAELVYNREKKTMKLSMPDYIDKMVSRFDIKQVSATPLPHISDEDALLDQVNEKPGFPYRELIGSLQWASTICRPDITRTVNLLSRYLVYTPTQKRVFNALKVLKYLQITKHVGIEYSPSREAAFNTTYGHDGHGQKVALGLFNLFTDASFAAKVDNHYSVNGLLLYYGGTPVAWKSGRQTIRSESTCQAEWIACAEGLKWVERMGFLEFFQKNYSPTNPIPDTLTLWTDSESVEACALQKEPKPASRHFILREFKVREFSD